MKASVVSFSQTEGEPAQIINATKVGAAWDLAAGALPDVTIAKGDPGALDQALEVMLDGDDSIIGRTLVVHADKEGKADKAPTMRCPRIEAQGGSTAAISREARFVASVVPT